ncbi:putative transcription factor interactor and regulator CCHC(Zn) family [Helianthus anomalus]
MKKVVDHVLDNDDIEESKSEFDKIVYNREFLLSKSNLDDELFKAAYTLNDSDKLYSDKEFPIRGVKTELINKVFKLTEINISEIKDLYLNEKPKKYTSRVQQRLNKKKNYNSGSGFQKKSNHNGNFKKKGLGFTPTEKQKNEKYVRDFKSKMIFVTGTSSEEEEEKKDFWRQSNNEFLAKKQDEMKKLTKPKKNSRTCFQCNIVGHIARDCSKAIQSKQRVSRKLKEKMRAKSDNQKWVVKKVAESSSDDSDKSKSEELSYGDESDSTKSDEPQIVLKGEALLKDEKSVPIVNDEDFPLLQAENYKKKIGKVEISNQFYNDKHEFDAEKVFNPKVKHIFGKMIDRKVKGVKEFYEEKRKGKKLSDGDSVKPKAGQAWVDIFSD